jgi:hypothetical protein
MASLLSFGLNFVGNKIIAENLGLAFVFSLTLFERTVPGRELSIGGQRAKRF